MELKTKVAKTREIEKLKKLSTEKLRHKITLDNKYLAMYTRSL
ncbi:MAG: hypothetical protein AABY38_05180 [Planctomycetota bacterium]